MKLQEFDFRVWDNRKKCYLGKNSIGVSFHLVKADDGLRISYPFYEVGQELPQAKDCDIELYTGHKDKNGKPIYENDIVYDDRDKLYYKIAQEINGAWVLVDDVNGNMLLAFKSDLEVVGNIHEDKFTKLNKIKNKK